MLFYVNIYESYKLSETVLLFAHLVHVAHKKTEQQQSHSFDVWLWITDYDDYHYHYHRWFGIANQGWIHLDIT